METVKITMSVAHELNTTYLHYEDKKQLGITGYQMVTAYGWYIEHETDAAILLAGTNETGTYSDKDIEDVKIWLPKSQIKAFKCDEDDEDNDVIIFVKTWLFNQERSTIKLNHFKSYA